MINPQKYMNLENSVIAVSAVLLRNLRANQILKHDEASMSVIAE
jgi:hypothetical protein